MYLGIFQTTFAVEPICTVPQLPGNLDSYTDEEAIYFDKLMEYYLPAVTLEAQLKLMNITPKMKVPILSSEMLDNMDPKYFKQYNKLAFELYSQIKNLKMDVVNKQLFDSESENKILKKDNTQLMIDTIGTHKYRELYQMLLEAIDKSISDNKQIEKKYVEKIRNLLNEISDTKYNLSPNEKATPSFVLSFTPIIEQFYYNDDRIGSEIAPGVIVNMNALRISKNVGLINLWGKFCQLTTQGRSGSNYPPNQSWLTYKNDQWAFGGDFELNISALMKTESVGWSFKAGFGYMKGFIRVPNVGLPQYEYTGNIIKLETDFYNLNKLFPFGITLGANFNKFNRDLAYPNFQNNINLGKIWVPSIYFGLNFNLLQVY
jgi:hypothetical protein